VDVIAAELGEIQRLEEVVPSTPWLSLLFSVRITTPARQEGTERE
jgi:hypothetical protein